MTAPITPPLTGQSINVIPLSANILCNFLTIDKEFVEESMTIVFESIPSSIPFSSKQTFSTSAGIGRHINIMSLPFAHSAGEFAQFPPDSRISIADS